MVRSMTGFGRGKAAADGLDITVELKSVNHRYFEFSSRLPKGYMFLDEKLKSFCQNRISRGKLEASVLIEESGGGDAAVELNETDADSFMAALKNLSDRYKIKNDVKVSDLVGIPELFILKKHTVPDETVAAAVIEAAGEAILEAMVGGLPQIVTKVCGYAHYVDEAQSGILLVDPFDQNEFNHCLLHALDRNQLSEWRQRARLFADQEDLYSLPQKAADIILG